MKKISKDLNYLFWAQFCGALNDNVFKNAMIILVTYQGISLMGINSSGLVALSGGIFILPFVFLSAMSGQLADRFEKTKLVKIIKKVEIIIACLAIFGLHQKNYSLLLFVLFLFGLHSTFFGPLKYSLIPDYASEKTLVFANALISSGTFVAILFGTIIGGMAISDDHNFFGLKFVLLFCAIVGWYFANQLTPTVTLEVKKEEVIVDWNFWRSSKQILKLVFKNPMIGILIIGLSWFWFLGAGLLSLLPLLAKNVFYGTEQVATLMLFVFTMGMGIGPFVLDRLTRGRVVRALIPLSLIAMSFFIFDVALVISSVEKQSSFLGVWSSHNGLINVREFFQLKMSTRVMVDLFLLALFGGSFTVPQFAELQRIASRSELSRLVAGNNIVNAVAMVMVSLFLMFLHQQEMELSVIFEILGLFNILMSVALIFVYRLEFNKILRF